MSDLVAIGLAPPRGKPMIRDMRMSVLSAVALALSFSFGLPGAARGQMQAEVPVAVIEDFHRTCAREIDRLTQLGSWVQRPDRLFRDMMYRQETRTALQRFDAQEAAQVRQLPAGTEPDIRQMVITTAAFRHCSVRVAMRYTPDSVTPRPEFVGQWVPVGRAYPASSSLAFRTGALTIVPQPGGLAVTADIDGVSGLYVEQARAADVRRFRRDLPSGASLQISFYDAAPDAIRLEEGPRRVDFRRVIVRSFAPNTAPLPPAPAP